MMGEAKIYNCAGELRLDKFQFSEQVKGRTSIRVFPVCALCETAPRTPEYPESCVTALLAPLCGYSLKVKGVTIMVTPFFLQENRIPAKETPPLFKTLRRSTPGSRLPKHTSGKYSRRSTPLICWINGKLSQSVFCPHGLFFSR